GWGIYNGWGGWGPGWGVYSGWGGWGSMGFYNSYAFGSAPLFSRTYPLGGYPAGVVSAPLFNSPPTYIQQNTAQTAAPRPAPVQSNSYWYFCRNPEGYYPTVKECPMGWIKVPPQPS
ncbi:MAG: hypothetical protein LM517_12680, partial [Nitrosomonas sp.]|nr:hypothetical protein [Nitrosomonas sp.]